MGPTLTPYGDFSMAFASAPDRQLAPAGRHLLAVEARRTPAGRISGRTVAAPRMSTIIPAARFSPLRVSAEPTLIATSAAFTYQLTATSGGSDRGSDLPGSQPAGWVTRA